MRCVLFILCYLTESRKPEEALESMVIDRPGGLGLLHPYVSLFPSDRMGEGRRFEGFETEGLLFHNVYFYM